MRKLCNGHYIHRGESIIKDDTGYLDGTNTKEPRVIDE